MVYKKTRSHSFPPNRDKEQSPSSPAKATRAKSLPLSPRKRTDSIPYGAASPRNETKTKKPKAPPVASLFSPREILMNICDLPGPNPAWGRIPIPGPEGPGAHPEQPSARGSMGQTIPPLWEDRKHRFQLGSRYVKSFKPAKGKNTNEDDENWQGPLLDQEEWLEINLIDMRPTKPKKDPTPRRLPIFYQWEGGAPHDWSSKQAIKALNDRQKQAIDRITKDQAWTAEELEVLAEIFQRYPDISILEATEHFNWHFAGEGGDGSDLGIAPRTIESVRAEYLLNQDIYDNGEVPKVNKRRLRKAKKEDEDAGDDSAEEQSAKKKKKKGSSKAKAGEEQAGPSAKAKGKRKAVEVEDESSEKPAKKQRTTQKKTVEKKKPALSEKAKGKRKADDLDENSADQAPQPSRKKRNVGVKSGKPSTRPATSPKVVASKPKRPSRDRPLWEHPTYTHPEQFQSGTLLDNYAALGEVMNPNRHKWAAFFDKVEAEDEELARLQRERDELDARIARRRSEVSQGGGSLSQRARTRSQSASARRSRSRSVRSYVEPAATHRDVDEEYGEEE